eukprot:Em0010g992a
MPSRQKKERAKRRARYLEVRDDVLESARASYNADPEKKRTAERESYKADPEKKRSAKRESYQVDPEKKRSAKKKRYWESPERARLAKRVRLRRLSVVSCKTNEAIEEKLPTKLFKGKLVEYYVSLEDEKKADPETLRKALMDRAGISKDPLASAKVSSERRQGEHKTMTDFEGALKKLFKEAYPEETASTSGVLRQRFLTGLRSEITKHILLRGNPTTLDQAVKDAVSIERALAFEDGHRIAPVQAVRAKILSDTSGGNEELQKTLDQVLKRLEGLEARFGEKQVNDTRPRRRCYRCGKEGHIRRNCSYGKETRGVVSDREEERSDRTSLKVCGVNFTTLQVQGMLAGRPLGFLIDSGAAVSVVTYGVLPSSIRAKISNVAPIAIGANGSPLDVVGRVNIEITMDTFCTNHSFIVVQKLTVDCLLGMDFLAKHGAVIDCVKNSLSLTSGSAYLQLHETKKPVSDIVAVVSVSETVQISARSKGFVRGTVTHPGIKAGQEGLVEPKYKGQGRLLVARSLNTVDPQNEVPIQVINTGHEPITLYSGMSIASFSSSVEIMSVSDKEHSPDNMQGDGMPDVDLAGANLSPSQKHDLNRLIWEFRDLFVSEGGCTGRTSVIKHTIRTEGSPIRQPLRRIPFVLQDTVKTEIKMMLQQGVIRKSCSPWSSPVVMIKKKDGAWRFCINFRKVNSVTHKDAYPLPRIDETLESLSGSQYFTTLDLASGYWQVELCSVPHFLNTLNDSGQCLNTLPHAGLKLKPNKCHFARSEIRYLGHIVSRDGVKADPEKLRAITSYPIPRDVKELRQFLGLANYYRRFIEGYSVIAEPLHKLTRKSAAGYKWTDECGRAFLALQQRLVSPPILAYPQFAHKFTLATDASDSALGGILSQVINGQERVISYWSRQLNKAERNYSTVEREALAVVAAVKEFYPYLYGRPFTLYTDHNPLTSLHGLKDTGGRLTRWLLYLQQFDMIVLYRPGRNNGNADGLSRRPEIYREQVSEVYGITCSVGDSEMLRQEQAKDAYTSEIIQKLQEGKHSAKLDDFLLEDGILVRQLKTSTCSNPYKQVVVPIALRQTILEQLHNNAGHLGIHKTFEKVKERFFWPGLPVDVMLGRVQHLKKKLPQYVQNVQRSLKDTFSSVRQHLDATHQRQKLSADRSSTGESTFQIQLISGTKCQTVHSNRLKLYNGHPEPISRTEKNVGHSRPDQPDVASGHVMVEEEDGEEEDMIQEEAIREDVEEALVQEKRKL